MEGLFVFLLQVATTSPRERGGFEARVIPNHYFEIKIKVRNEFDFCECPKTTARMTHDEVYE
jgi:hypothetical protein